MKAHHLRAAESRRRCDQPPVRADRGSDISKENPSFEAGAAGGCGSMAGLALPAAFVSVPIATRVTAGGCQAQRAADAFS